MKVICLKKLNGEKGGICGKIKNLKITITKFTIRYLEIVTKNL